MQCLGLSTQPAHSRLPLAQTTKHCLKPFTTAVAAALVAKAGQQHAQSPPHLYQSILHGSAAARADTNALLGVLHYNGLCRSLCKSWPATRTPHTPTASVTVPAAITDTFSDGVHYSIFVRFFLKPAPPTHLIAPWLLLEQTLFCGSAMPCIPLRANTLTVIEKWPLGE